MLEENRNRVRNLTGSEIWLFIIGRSLMAFGVGVMAMTYFPDAAAPLAWPTIVIGLLLFLAASRGLLRKP